MPGQKRDRSIWVAGLVAVALFAAPAHAAAPPTASFDITPANPRAGEPIQLTSSSCDPDGRLWSEDWDLDGDGFYGEATGPTASVTFTDPGTHLIGLQVMSANGDVSTQLSPVVVDAANAPPRPEPTRLISPFPVITLGGRLQRAATGVNLFTVRAPLCATVVVACRGRGCPLRSVTAHVGDGDLRLRAVERRFRAGNRLTGSVSKGTLLGKLTEFRFRRHRPPLRTDSCLVAATGEGAQCPSG